jgi:hypothetical protein
MQYQSTNFFQIFLDGLFSLVLAQIFLRPPLELGMFSYRFAGILTVFGESTNERKTPCSPLKLLFLRPLGICSIGLTGIEPAHLAVLEPKSSALIGWFFQLK